MSKVSALHEQWSRDPNYQAAYDELGPEFELARSLIKVRIGADLTQAQLAERMKTTQPVAAWLERRTRPPVHKDAGEDRQGHRYPAQDQL